jgi:hypothetical protein
LLEIIWLGHFFFQSGALFSWSYERNARTSRSSFGMQKTKKELLFFLAALILGSNGL